MRVSTRTLHVAAVLLVAALARLVAGADASEPKTVRGVLTTRPSPKFEDLAERSSPDRRGDDAMESFWDILKLRDNPDPRAVAALGKILEAHVDSSRIHRFAAAQALFQIGTPDALRALEKDVARPDYPVDLAVMYTTHWEMAEPARSQLLARHLLRAAGDKTLDVTVVPEWRDRDGRRVLNVTVKLTNRAAKPITLLMDLRSPSSRLHFRSAAGAGAGAGAGGTFAAERGFGVRQPPRPRWVRLTPGASEQFDVTLELTRDAETLARFRTDSSKAVLSSGDAGFGLAALGKHRVYAMFAQLPVSEGQFKALSKWAKGVADAKELWVGRAVSEPVEVEIPEADAKRR